MFVVEAIFIVLGEKVGAGLDVVPSGILVFLILPVAVYGNTGFSTSTGSVALLW